MSKEIIVIPEKTSNERKPNEIKKIRVAAYTRVSTEKDRQQHSLNAQIDFYSKLIQQEPNWIYAGLYYDEGLSGLSTAKREGFKNLINDAMNNKIDFIITKSISRFARNTIDTLTITRKLKSLGVGVFFEKENFNTLDNTSDFILTVLASIAEEESKSISANVKWAIRNNFKKGKVSVPYTNFLGYKQGDSKFCMVVDKEQSKIVKLIYRLFLEGNNCAFIATWLTLKGIPTPQGKSTWSSSVVKSILSNEKYIGDALLQKQYIKDIFSKRAIDNNGELPQYYVKNDHKAIIPKNVFNEVQNRMKCRTEYSFYCAHSYSSYLRCDLCGNLYRIQYHYDYSCYEKPIKRWICSNKHNKNVRCKNSILYDDELNYALDEIYKMLFSKYEIDIKEIKAITNKISAEDITMLSPSNLIPNNEYIKQVVFRTIFKEVIVKENRILYFTLIDGTTIEHKLPKWDIKNKRPWKAPEIKPKTNTRKARYAELKIKVIEEHKQGTSQYRLAFKYNLDRSTVKRWIREDKNKVEPL